MPLTPEEIIADVRQCRDVGATIFHLHTRDVDGLPTFTVGIPSVGERSKSVGVWESEIRH